MPDEVFDILKYIEYRNLHYFHVVTHFNYWKCITKNAVHGKKRLLLNSCLIT